MGKIKDFSIWHIDTYGDEAQDLSRADEYIRERGWQYEKFEKVKEVVQKSSRRSTSDIDYDIFVSHASEDKKGFVRPLVSALSARNIKIWYDEFEIKIGMSLRRSIDRGLSKSKFGVVVLSHSFFKKKWPQYEMDGLVQKDMKYERVILPIWYGVSHDDVMGYSPSLADKLAIDSQYLTIDEIADELAEIVRGKKKAEGKSEKERRSKLRNSAPLKKGKK